MRTKLKTIGYAIPTAELDAMTRALDLHPELVKKETPNDDDGHVVEYKYHDKPIFFAMIHSNRLSYLVRALPGLFTTTAGASIS